MNTIPVPVHSSNEFMYIGKNKTFICELSDLGPYQIASRLYEDACDIGFGIKSARTEKVMLFRITHFNGEKAVAVDLNGDGFEVIIFND